MSEGQKNIDALVLYDAACAICKQLAEMAARHAGPDLAFAPWQEWQKTPDAPPELSQLPADKLRVFLRSGELLEGQEAWALLLERHSDLKALDWLAAKMGLRQATAQGLLRAGDLLRRLCPRCGYRPRSSL